MTIWFIPLSLLTFKGFQHEGRRLILINIILPLILLLVIIGARSYNYKTYFPDMYFSPVRVNDPSRTQLVHPRSTSVAVEVIAVDDFFGRDMKASNIDHGFDLEEIRKNIIDNLTPLDSRSPLDSRTNDIEVYLSRINGTPHAAISVLPASTQNSPFQFANLLLWQRRSIVLPRELDLIRDGTVFVMHQIASAFAPMLPNFQIKIDDLKGRTVDAFVEEYHRFLPIVVTMLAALRVLSIINRMMDERMRRVHLGLVTYGIPRTLNSTAWIIVAILEVVFNAIWIMVILQLSAVIAGDKEDPLLTDMSTYFHFFIALIGFSVTHALFGILCVLVFGKYAFYIYIGMNVIHTLFYLRLIKVSQGLCLSGTTNLMVTFGGPFTLAVALRLSTPANLPIIADFRDFMRCVGKGATDLITYPGMMCIQIFWSMVLLACILLCNAIPFTNESYRWARYQYPSTRRVPSQCGQRKAGGAAETGDASLIQVISPRTRIVMAMREISYSSHDGELILDNFNLAIPSGQIVSLVGDVEDAGDVIMAILSGICTTYLGQVTYYASLVSPDILSTCVAVCPSEPFLIEAMSIKHNIKVFLSVRHTMDTMTYFGNLMKELGMSLSFDTPCNKLSDSDKRKVIIGMTLLAASDVVVLEEPTKDLNLDDIGKLAVLLHREQRKRGMLLITTNAEFAESVSERVNIMFDGSVVYSGSVTGVVQNLLELPPSMVMYLRLPPKDGVQEHAEFSNMKLLSVIKDLHDGVNVIHVSRQRVVLQIRGSDELVLEVYETFTSRQQELNIQKIIITEPSLRNVIDLAFDKKVNLALVGEQRQIHRGTRDKWDSCKTGLRRQGERLRLETLFKQTKRMCYMAWNYSIRRGILPVSIVCAMFMFLLDCTLYPIIPEGPITQMRSFHKRIYGIFCNSSSYNNTPVFSRSLIINALSDIDVPAVSTAPGKLGQICLEVQVNSSHSDEEITYMIHTPITAVHDFVVFLSRLYNAFIAPANPIYWYYRESLQAILVRLVSDELSFYYWTLDFGYLILATILITTDMYFFGRSRVHFTRGRLVQSGLRKCAFWVGIIAFTITKNTIILLVYDLRMYALVIPYADAVDQSVLMRTKAGTIVLGTAQAAMVTGAIANLPVTQWFKTEMLTSLFLANLMSSSFMFFLESFVFEIGDDQIANRLILIAAFLPAYQRNATVQKVQVIKDILLDHVPLSWMLKIRGKLFVLHFIFYYLDLVFTLRRLKLSNILSRICGYPEITEDICPRYPSLAPLCCEKACHVLVNRCRFWDIDAFSARTGIGRFGSLGILFALHLIFVIMLLCYELFDHPLQLSVTSGEQKEQQMRLQKRKLFIDSYGIAERETCEDIEPLRWNGLLVRHLCVYSDNHFVLKDITFSVAAGEIVAIFGKEGPARTMLLRAIAGIEAVEESTEISAARCRVPLPFSKRRHIGLACDLDELPTDLTVEDYLDIYNTIRDVPAGWQKYHLDLTLRIFGIEDIRKLSIGKLNYPRRKMVCVASAFVGCPYIAILDDPLDGLDRADRDRMRNALNSLKSRDTAILFSSSSLEDSSLVDVDRAGVLIGSELVTMRTLPDLLMLDTGYHIIVRLQSVTDQKVGPKHYEQQKDVVLKLLASKFTDARLVLQVGCMCEFHIRGENVTCRSINEVKRTIVETLTQAQEIKIGHLSGKRRLTYLIDALLKNRGA